MIELSPQAQEVLDIATELLTISMKDREHWHYENEKDYPELEHGYNLQAWDAGYYQLKKLWREYPELWKEFQEAYKKLEDKMRPMVYELGFLRKW